VFTALLDTCVLWPSLQRDFLLALAVEATYRPLWSSAILEELEEHETRKLIERGADRATAVARTQRLLEQMRSRFDDAEVRGWEGLEGTYGLADPDDEHLVAAAVVGGAGAIVTHNVKDLPDNRLPEGIKVIRPAAFAYDTVALHPTLALKAVEEIAARSGRRGELWTPDDVLDNLASRYAMNEAVDELRAAFAARPPDRL
jgi:predicted nucleic acid-binding protein